jgi:hypothetical protein
MKAALDLGDALGPEERHGDGSVNRRRNGGAS